MRDSCYTDVDTFRSLFRRVKLLYEAPWIPLKYNRRITWLRESSYDDISTKPVVPLNLKKHSHSATYCLVYSEGRKKT